MDKIKIITDSTADLPLDIIKRYDIEVIPLQVIFGEDSYNDGSDINIHEFFQKIKATGIFPTTSSINPKSYYDSFNKYLEDGYKILVITISSKLSGTYQSSCIAKKMLETQDIRIIDSLNVTSGLGILVLNAAKLVESGHDLKFIEDKTMDLIPHVKSALAFESLEHLIKGGRLSWAAGTIGNVLGIKLILTVIDGKLEVLDKVRGSKRATRRIIDYMDEHGIMEGQTSILLSVAETEVHNALLSELFSKQIDFLESEVGCVVGTHSGPGACGIFFVENY